MLASLFITSELKRRPKEIGKIPIILIAGFLNLNISLDEWIVRGPEEEDRPRVILSDPSTLAIAIRVTCMVRGQGNRDKLRSK
jgi:hypothetical protein